MARSGQKHLSEHAIRTLQELAPGTMVDLQITTPTSPKRMRTQYVGMDIPNGMLFQVPQTNKWAMVRDLLLPGKHLVVRFVIEGDMGQVIAFRVPIIKLLSKPLSILVTEFPTSIQTLGLRSERRTQPGIPVKLCVGEKTQADAKDKCYQGLLVDVSKNGSRLAVPIGPETALLSVNIKITIFCHLDGEAISISGEIKNKTEENAYFYYGIQFSNQSEKVDALLERHFIVI